MTPGYATETSPRPPPTIWEEASVTWRHAKERLEQCRADLERAQTAVNQAVQEERSAWISLESAAGRNEAKPMVAVQSPYAMNGQLDRAAYPR